MFAEPLKGRNDRAGAQHEKNFSEMPFRVISAKTFPDRPKICALRGPRVLKARHP